MCVLIFSRTFKTFLILGKSKREILKKMFIGPHVKYYCQILTETEFFQQIFEKYLNIKFG